MFQVIKKIIFEGYYPEELVKGGTIALALRLVGIGFGYFFTLLITHNYGADAMGIFALCITLLTIFSVIGRLGLDTALLRYTAMHLARDESKSVKETYLKAAVIALPLSFLLSILLFYFSDFIAVDIFKNDRLTYPLMIAALGIAPLVLLHINTECLRGAKKIKSYLLLQDTGLRATVFFFLGVVIVFLDSRYDPISVYVSGVFLLCCISMLVWLDFSKSFGRWKFDGRNIIELVKIASPMFMSSSLFLVIGWIDTLMLGIFRSEQEVGIYAVALKVSTLASLTLVAVNSIAAPKFAEYWGHNDLASIQKFGQKSTILILLTSLPVLLALFFLPSQILALFGSEFAVGSLALILLASGQLVNIACGSVGLILQMTGEEKVFQYIVLGAALLNIALNLLLIPIFGINGVAAASMLSLFFLNATSTYMLYLKHRIIVFVR